MCKGEGIYLYASGDKYEGNFLNGVASGRGRYSKAKLGLGLIMVYDVYEGEYKDDLKHGAGVYRYANGDIFEGTYENDQWSRGQFTTGATGEVETIGEDGFYILSEGGMCVRVFDPTTPLSIYFLLIFGWAHRFLFVVKNIFFVVKYFYLSKYKYDNPFSLRSSLPHADVARSIENPPLLASLSSGLCDEQVKVFRFTYVFSMSLIICY